MISSILNICRCSLSAIADDHAAVTAWLPSLLMNMREKMILTVFIGSVALGTVTELKLVRIFLRASALRAAVNGDLSVWILKCPLTGLRTLRGSL